MTLHGPARLVSSLTPAPPSQSAAKIVRLDDQPIQKTGDRWYRELIQAEVTQFVGSIPPGRAPDHVHTYEEVICILDGFGIMHAGASSTPVARGSCIFLPIRQRHCLENIGSGELRLVGVFYPAGSPAVRYPV
jgi:mannose-6-phosphate isomerase-like protein (cupin superfamily)